MDSVGRALARSITCCMTATLAGLLAPPAGAQQTLLVGKNGYATIQEAVDAAKEEETTILIAAGAYHENVNLSGVFSVQLQGIGKVIIDGGDSGPAISATNSNRVQLLNLRCRTANGHGMEFFTDAGFSHVGPSQARIEKCRIDNASGNGIHAVGLDIIVILGTKIFDAGGHGVFIDDAEDARVGSLSFETITDKKHRNVIKNIGLDGVNMDVDPDGFPGSGVVALTTIKNIAGRGIAYHGIGADFVKNTIALTQQDGIVVTAPETGPANRLWANKVKKAGGNGCVLSDAADVSENTFTKPLGDGIHADASASQSIQSNKIIKPAGDGIDLASDGNSVTSNVVKAAAECGFRLGGSGNDVESNVTKKSGEFGLCAPAGARNTYVDNQFDSVDPMGDVP